MLYILKFYKNLIKRLGSKLKILIVYYLEKDKKIQ